MQKHTLWFVIVITCTCILSCKHDKMEDYINKNVGAEFMMPKNVLCVIQKNPIESDFSEFEFKIIHCIDSTGCIPCKMKIRQWKKTMEYFHKQSAADVALIFIVQQQNAQNIIDLLYRNDYNFYAYIDTVGIFFNSLNLPRQEQLHTFLLDSSNIILAVGNPLANQSIRQLYVNLMTNTSQMESNSRKERHIPISCNPTYIVGGAIHNNETKRFAINLFNESNDDIRIDTIISSCECLSAQIQFDSILGLTSRRFVVSLSNDSIKGRFERTLDIFFEGYDTPISITIQVYGI